MSITVRFYSPNQADETADTGLGAGTPTDEKSVTDAHERDWRGNDTASDSHLTDTKLDAKREGDD